MLSSLFFIVCAIAMPFVELGRLATGRFSARRFRSSLVVTGVVLTMLGSLVVVLSLLRLGVQALAGHLLYPPLSVAGVVLLLALVALEGLRMGVDLVRRIDARLRRAVHPSPAGTKRPLS